MPEPLASKSIAVAIPCYNEAVTIAQVISDFKAFLPQAVIYVVDNNSTDGSPEIARQAGAQVLRENRQGKGYTMQAILEYIKADALVVVDGDGTYPAEEVHRLLEPILNEEADMVVGTRLKGATDQSYRRLNRWGTQLLSGILNLLFGTRFTDILSGYRAFSRRLMEQIPIVAGGFETEAEITIQTLSQGLTIKEVPITYRSRPGDSRSKLRPFRDGFRILLTIAVLLRDHRPLVVFGTLGLIFIGLGMIAGLLRILNYFGYPTFSNALLTGSLLWMASLGIALLGLGFVLNAINTRFKEISCLMRRTRYDESRYDTKIR